MGKDANNRNLPMDVFIISYYIIWGYYRNPTENFFSDGDDGRDGHALH